MTYPRHRPDAANQFGFTLLEALITIVVVSIGLLGILGLQTASLVNTQVSTARGAATVIADNFAARMMANPQGNYDDIEIKEDQASDTVSINIGGTDVSVDPQCGTNGVCTFLNDADIVEYAALEWGQTLAEKLPNGEGYVDCLDDTDCDRYLITVVWSEHDPSNNDDTDPPDLCDTGPRKATKHRCYVTEVRP